ncbi:MAG: DNA polymerase V [Lentisphaeria bacterium]|jgi:DNA polymerase V
MVKNPDQPKKSSRPTAGFGGSYDDYLTPALDLNALLVSKPAATVFMRVNGDDMEGGGVSNGDILVLDRSITPVAGHIVVAVVDGQFVVRNLLVTKDGVELHKATGQTPQVFTEGIEITGVVTSAIKQFVKLQ